MTSINSILLMPVHRLCYGLALFCFALRQCLLVTNTDTLLMVPLYLWVRILLVMTLALLVVKLAYQKYEFRTVLLMTLIGMVGFVSMRYSGSKELLLLALLVFSAQDVSFRECAISVLCGLLLGLVFVVGGAFVGAITSMVMDVHASQGAEVASIVADGPTRNSMGFNHPNSFAMLVLAALGCFLAARFPRFNIIDFAMCAILGVMVLAVTESRASVLGIVILCFSFLVSSRVKSENGARLVLGFFVGAVAVSVVVSLLVMIFYNPESSVLAKLDYLLSTRLSLANGVYRYSGLTLFGFNYSDINFVVDNAYSKVLLVYGVIPGFLLLLAEVALCRLACKEQSLSSCVICLGVWSLVGIAESYALSPVMNIGLLGLSCLLFESSLRGFSQSRDVHKDKGRSLYRFRTSERMRGEGGSS